MDNEKLINKSVDYLEKLESLAKIDNQLAVEFFTNSDLPNSYFLQQFFEPYPKPFCKKEFWPGFADVLVKRGIKKLDDVKVDMLIWLQDINWPGCGTIVLFVRKNIRYFRTALIESLSITLEDDDKAWFVALIWQFCYWTEENDREIVEKTKSMYDKYQENKSIEERKKIIDFVTEIYEEFEKSIKTINNLFDDFNKKISIVE